MSKSFTLEEHRIHTLESKIKPALILLFRLLLIPIGACAHPLLLLSCRHSQFYNCFEATPADLVGSYFSGYTRVSYAEAQYNNQYFVFKNLPVKDWWTWIWIKAVYGSAVV